MTIRDSNTTFLGVLDPLPLEQVGWYCKVLAESDYATVIAQVFRFRELTFLKEHNGTGGGGIAIDADDPLWTLPLPAGQTVAIIDQQAIWQVYEDGILRGEFFAEDVEQDVVTESGDRVHVISGRGVGACMEWAILPNTPGSAPGEVGQSGFPMATILAMFTAANVRGSLTFLTTTFDSTTDSTGAAWTDSYMMTYSHGDTILDTLTTWCDQIGATWKMLPGMRLWIEKNSGNDLTDTVVFPIGIAQQAHNKRRSRRELGNVLYAVSSDGAQGIATDTASITKWRRRERWIEAGQAGDSAAASAAASVNLGLFKDQRVSREVEIITDQPGRRLFVDFDVWDWVRVEADTSDTDAVEMRINSASIVVDSNGHVRSELTLGSRYDEAEVLAAKQIKKLEAAKVPAKGVAKKTGSPSGLATRSIGDLKDVGATTFVAGDTFVYNSTTQVFEAVPNALDQLTDVVAPAPVDGNSLVWDAGLGYWKPAAPGGGKAIKDRRWVAEGAPVIADDFDDATLDAAWGRVDHGNLTAHAEWTEASDSLSLRVIGTCGATMNLHAMMRPYSLAIGQYVQAGFQAFARTNYCLGGIVIANGNTQGAGAQVTFGGHTPGNSLSIRTATNYLTQVSDVGNVATLIWNPSMIHVRAKYSAANTWEMYVSPDGVSWLLWTSTTYTLTPTHVGVGWTSWGGANTGIVSVDYFRVYSP